MAPKPKIFVRDWRLKLIFYFSLLAVGLVAFLGIGPSLASNLPYDWFEFLAIVYLLCLTFAALTGELFRNRFWKQLLKS